MWWLYNVHPVELIFISSTSIGWKIPNQLSYAEAKVFYNSSFSSFVAFVNESDREQRQSMLKLATGTKKTIENNPSLMECEEEKK